MASRRSVERHGRARVPSRPARILRLLMHRRIPIAMRDVPTCDLSSRGMVLDAGKRRAILNQYVEYIKQNR